MTTFIVELGLSKTTVEADDVDEAIAVAKRKLCDFWPNHWDMIYAKADECFKVEKIGPA